MSNPNATGTFGSMGSEGNVAAAIRACADLKEKMKPVREEGLAWMELVKRCYSRGIDLTGHHQCVFLCFLPTITYNIIPGAIP